MKPTRLALLVLAAALALPAPARADDFADIRKEIVKRHDEAVQRLARELRPQRLQTVFMARHRSAFLALPCE